MSDARLHPARGGVAPRVATSGMVALVLLGVLWETVLAPLRGDGASWLALKAVPLALLLPGVLHGRRRARQVATLLLPWYVAEGVVRAFSEGARHALVAGASAALALATFLAMLVWLRQERAASAATP